MSARDPRDLEREPPVNLQAEQALLGCLLDSNKVWDSISGLVTAEAFADGAHQRIFERIQRLVERGEPANAVTLKNAFERDAGLAEVGGAQYLASLQASAITPSMAPGFARLVTDTYLRRRGIAICEDAIDALHDFDLGGDSGEAVRQAADQLDEAAREAAQAGGEGPRDLRQLGEDTLDAIEAAMKRRRQLGAAGLTTGLETLDEAIGGLTPGLIIVGARTSMGKTSLLEGIVYPALERNPEEGWVYWVSPDQSGEELMQREASRRTGIALPAIVAGRLREQDFTAIGEALRGLRGLKLKFDDRSRRLGPIAAQARHLKRRGGLKLLVVDYIQLMRPDRPQKGQNRTQEIEEISHGFQLLARELDVPVVVLSQINRSSQDRDDRRPRLDDLKQAGAIEEDAKVVLLLHREEYYLEREVPRRKAGEDQGKFDNRYRIWQEALSHAAGKAEILVAKNKQGPTPSLDVRWLADELRFADNVERPRIDPEDEGLFR